MIQPTKSKPSGNSLRQTIRNQLDTIHKLESNIRILLVMIEAIRAEYNLSQGKVEEISERFINAQVERDAEGKIDVNEFLGAADSMKEQLMKLKETIANGQMPPIVPPKQTSE